MSERLFSAHWYRVADLRPRLRGHVGVHRHVYRGQTWFVLEDPAGGRLHRFSPAAHAVIGLMDGERTVQAIWDAAVDRLGDAAPTQDQVVDLLGRLHRADVLQSEARTDARESEHRREAGERVRLGQRFKNPLAVRIPLVDPDRMLGRLRPLAGVIFSAPAGYAWLALVLLGLAVAGSNAAEIGRHASDRALGVSNLLLAAGLFPLVKLLHELGHALAVKRWGGEVHEAGLMLLVLAPLPYVDATGSAAFRSKYQRIAVSGAGIAVELALAAAATMLWASLEPGLLRDVAFNVMLIGGVSTLLFNGNPLLRFDGYFVLADFLEIPNLAERSRRYLGYLVLRHLFRVHDARSPVTAPGEAPWFAIYGSASFVYRLFITVVIVSYVAGRFFVVGLILAGIAVVNMVLLPLARQIAFLARSPLLASRRRQALALTGGALAVLVAFVVLVPMPLATRVEGVVWLPDHRLVRAGAPGFVTKVHVARGAAVSEGQALFELEDPFQETRAEVLEAELSELRVRKAVEAFRDRVKAAVIDAEIRTVRAELDRERELSTRRVVRSPADGHLVLVDAIDPLGRFVQQGEELAMVVDRRGLSVRAVVEQPDIALVRDQSGSVQIRFADRIGHTLTAHMMREVPAGNFLLPSAVLGTRGGGRIPVDADDSRGLEVARKVFQVELELTDALDGADVGQRVHVRFRHRDEPLAHQWRRRLEQAFLRTFGV